MVQPVSRLTGGKVGVPVNSVVPLNVNSVNFFTSVTGDEYLRTGVTDSNVTNYPDATPSYSVNNNTLHTFGDVDPSVISGLCFNETDGNYVCIDYANGLAYQVDNSGLPIPNTSFGVDLNIVGGITHDPATDKYYIGDSANARVIELDSSGNKTGTIIDVSNEIIAIRDVEIVGSYLCVAGVEVGTNINKIFNYNTSDWTFNNSFAYSSFIGGGGFANAITRFDSSTIGLFGQNDSAVRRVTIPAGGYIDLKFNFGSNHPSETPIQKMAYDPVTTNGMFVTVDYQFLLVNNPDATTGTLGNFSNLYQNSAPVIFARWVDPIDNYLVLLSQNLPIGFYDASFSVVSYKGIFDLPSGTNSIDYDGSTYYWCTHGTSVTRIDADFAPDTHTIDLTVSLSSVACVGSIIYASGANNRTIYTVDSSGNKLPEEYELSQYLQGDIDDIYFDGSYLWVLDSTNGQALKITIGGVSTGIQVSTGASSEYKILKITDTTAEFMRSGQGVANEYAASVGISDAKFDSDSGLPLYLRVK